MLKIIQLNENGVLCSDGKTYKITDFSRQRLTREGVQKAYLSRVGGFNAVVYKNNR